VVCISQARMGSSRLPGKVLLPVLGRPLLEWHVQRLQRARQIDRLVVATTVEPQDDPIAALCEALGVAVFRGSERDVLSRYAGAAAEHGAATVVRVTSDCPLIDPELVDRVVAAFLAADVDYMALDTTSVPRGLDTEVFTRAALDEAAAQATAAPEREHVTPYIYHRPQRFRLASVSPETPVIGRWCVDEPADYELVRRIIETLGKNGPGFSWRECAALLDAHPEWRALNSAVMQKKVAPASG
jgi:spore coat polysaccharide biosynthesis protein SpsF